MKASHLLRLFLAVLLTILSFACDDSDDSNDPPDYQDHISTGKRLLMDNNAAKAAESFEAALVLRPDSTDARYGLLLCGPMRFFNFIDEIVMTINAITFNPENNEEIKSASMNVSDIPIPENLNSIHAYLIDKVYSQIERSDQMYQELSVMGDVTFELESYPFRMAGEDLVVLGGRFSQADLHFIGGANALVDGVLKLLLALNLRFDYTKLGIDLGGSETESSIFDTLDIVFSLLYDLLTSETFPDFLKLEPITGPETMQSSGISLGDAFARLSFSLDTLAAGSLDDCGQLCFFDDNNNGQYEIDLDALDLGGALTLESDVAVVVKGLTDELGPIFYEGSPMDIDPATVQLLSLADLNQLFELLGLLPLHVGPFDIEEFPGNYGINVGKFFSEPDPEAIHNFLLKLATIWESPGDFFN